MAVTGTLEQIIDKVRKITGRPSANQMTDAEITDYINDFYVYEMPQHLKLWNLKNIESPLLATTPGGDDCLIAGEWLYAVDWNKYTNIAPPFYVGGYQIQYYQDSQSFLNYFPSRKSVQSLATATGIAGPYTGTVTNTPLLPESVFLSCVDVAGNQLTAVDNGAGTFTGDVVAGSTINYATGAIAALTWNAAIPAGNVITVQSLTYVEGRPLAVLYYNKALTFYPVPDVAYECYCTVYYNPDDLTAGDQPEIRQWWNVIAMGAALKIFIDNLDMESYAKLRPIFDEQKRLVERRTLQQLSNQRVATIYGDNVNWPCKNFGYPYN